MKYVFAFDNDGVLRDESVSYQRCVRETVAFFNGGVEPTTTELVESLKESNDDWDRTHKILLRRGVEVDFQTVKDHFQDLYLGKARDFSGYINNEPWLADNMLLAKLSQKYPLAIVSGAPKDEIEYTLQRNNALRYFSVIFGMYDCDGKKDGLEKVIKLFSPEHVMFCDDRPSPIKQARQIDIVRPFGIIPPQQLDDWPTVLKTAGAEKVFENVNEYCKFLLGVRGQLRRETLVSMRGTE